MNRAKPGTRVPLVCVVCGTVKYVKPYEAKTQKLCSQKCVGEYNARIKSTKIEKLCAQCGEPFMITPKKAERINCCSQECGNKHRTGKYVGDINRNSKPLPLNIVGWNGTLRGVVGVYQIRNTINDKIYIGSSTNIFKRFRQHYDDIRKQKHRNVHMLQEYNKYGLDVFEWSVLEVVEQKDDLYNREQYWLDITRSYDTGYNEHPKAGTSKGYKFRDGLHEKLSEAHKGLRPAAKLSETEVIEICEMMKQGLYDRDIEKITGTPVSSVNNIRRAHTWSHITLSYKQEREAMGMCTSRGRKGIEQNNSKLTENDVVVIWNRLLKGDGLSQIARDYNIVPQTIRSIKTRKTWSHITNLL